MRPDEYAKLAAVEDRMWYFAALHANLWRILSAGLPAQAEVLDAGCGTGGLIRRLAPRRRWTWTGIDVSPLALAHARATGPASARFVEGSIAALPFESASFDAIVCADVLMNVEDDARALAEFQRVLRPGGLVIINVPAFSWLWSYHDVAVGALRRYRRPDLRHRIERAGFNRVRATYSNFFPLPFVVVRRKLLPAPASGSDVELMPAPVEAVFAGLASLERAFLSAGGRIPVGTSVLADARRAK